MSSASKTPFADPLWLNRYYSPYYNESHRRLQREVREYVDTHIAPFCEEWEKQGFVPPEVCSFPMQSWPFAIIWNRGLHSSCG